MSETIDNKIKFTCTDRLNVTKTFDSAVNQNRDNKKAYTEDLLQQLKSFQTEVNTIMTSFVEAEKSIPKIDNKLVTSKNEDQSDEDEDENEDDDGEEVNEEDGSEDEKTDKPEKIKSDENSESGPNKKLCV
jgi:hypothetical protein